MDNFIADGVRLNYTNSTGSDISAGDVVVFGSILGIAVADIDNGDTGVLQVSGVFNLTALSTDTFTVGQLVYWDTTNSRLTETVDAAHYAAGICVEAKDGSTADVNILLNVGSFESDLLQGLTASYAELNVLDGVTAGTVTASKALVVDASKDLATLGTVDITTLEIGGTAVTSTAAELNILDGVTATAAELNMAADNSANVEVVTAANVITAAESGTTYFLNHATGFASTLPAPAAGLRYKFVVTTQPTSGNDTIVTDSGDNVIEGMADVDSTLVLAANEDTINLVASTCIVGDWVEVVSDGTSWFVSGASGATGGITFAGT